jgi:nucleotide-binding universal stress UspA family protein
MAPLRTIIVGVDFSETSRDALATGLEVAQPHGARLHLVHVVPDVHHAPWLVDAVGLDFVALQAQWCVEGEQGLAAVAARHGLDPLNITTAVLVGAPATEIVGYAAAQAADLIVVGSHGHSPFRRLILGSVADRVIRASSCPVLVVPHRAARLEPVGATRSREQAPACKLPHR